MALLGNKTAGFSILEVIISILLMAATVAMTAKYMSSKTKLLRKAIAVGREGDLRRYVRRNFDCSATLANPECATQTLARVAPKRCDGEPVGKNDGEYDLVGRYGVRTKCGTSIGANRVLVEASLIKGGVPGEEWRDVFRGIPMACGASATESFVLDGGRKLDILVSIDTSNSMAPHQNEIAPKLADLLLAVSPYDWRIAVNSGEFDHPSFPITAVINKGDADPATAFFNAATMAKAGSTDERILRMAAYGVEAQLHGGPDWTRDGSSLAIILITDTERQRAGSDEAHDKLPYFKSVLNSKWVYGETARLHGFLSVGSLGSCHDEGDGSGELLAIVNETGGVATNLCAPSYTATLNQMSQDLKFNIKTRYTLNGVPVPSSVSVTVDGVPLDSATFTVKENVVILDESPAGEATVEISYSENSGAVVASCVD